MELCVNMSNTEDLLIDENELADKEIESLKQNLKELNKTLFDKMCTKPKTNILLGSFKMQDNLSEENLQILFNLSRYFGSSFYQWNEHYIYITFNSSINGIYSECSSLKFIKTSLPYKFYYNLPFTMPKQEVNKDEEALDVINYAATCYEAFHYRKNQYDGLKDFFEQNNISLFHSLNYITIKLTFNNAKNSKINLNYEIDSKTPAVVTFHSTDFSYFEMEPEEIIDLFENKSLHIALDLLLKHTKNHD